MASIVFYSPSKQTAKLDNIWLGQNVCLTFVCLLQQSLAFQQAWHFSLQH